MPVTIKPPTAMMNTASRNVANNSTRAASAARAAAMKGGFSPLGAVNGVVGTVANVTMVSSLIGGIVKWSSKHAPGFLKPTLNTVTKVTSLPDVHLSGFSNAVTASFGPNTVTKTIANTQGAIVNYAQNTLSTKTYNSLAELSKKNTLSSVVVNGSMVISQATNAVMTFGGRFRALRQMQHELTGTFPSTWALLWGNKDLHPEVARARSELNGWKSNIGTALQLGGTFANAFMMLTGKGMTGKKGLFLSMGVGMGTSMVANTLTQSQTALSSYTVLHTLNASNQPIEPVVVQTFLGGLNPNANDEMLAQLSHSLVEQGITTPKAIIDSPEFKQLRAGKFTQPAAMLAAPVVKGKFQDMVTASRAPGRQGMQLLPH